jgi:hypothetical protein
MTQSALRFLFILLLSTAGCAVLAPSNEPLRFQFDKGTRVEGSPVLIFQFDGVRADVFDQMLAAGEIPNIRKYLVERGLRVKRAVTVMPTLTHAVNVAAITGIVPGRTGITGIHWFDREALVNRRYNAIQQKNMLDGDYSQPTLFSAHREGWTMSIFFQPHKGATRFVENRLSAGPPYFLRWYQLVDRLTAERFSIQADLTRLNGRFPVLTAAHFIGPDSMGHDKGLERPEYRAAIRNADTQLGRILKNYETAGILSKLTVVLFSDHGMVPIPRHVKVDKFLDKNLGIPTAKKFLWEETRLEDRLKYYNRCQAVVTGSGGCSMYIYLRRPSPPSGFESWFVRPDIEQLRNYPTGDGKRVDIIGYLTQRPEIAQVFARSAPDRVRVFSAKGVSEIESDPARGHRYAVLEGEDPLGCAPNEKVRPLLDGNFHPTQVWRLAALDTPCPGVIWQAVDFMKSPRVGDVAIFPAPGWGFVDDEANEYSEHNVGGHGGISAAESLVPMIIAGPGIPHGEIETASIIDIAPTILELWKMQGALREELQGRSILSQVH